MVQTSKNRRIFAPMKIKDIISALKNWRTTYHVLKSGGFYPFDWKASRYRFGKTLFFNITELLTDIYSEVKWFTKSGVETEKFKAWRSFVNRNGQRLLSQLYITGYAVIAWRMDDDLTWRFWQMKSKEYTERTIDDTVIIETKDKNVSYYVMRSPTYESRNISDYDLCEPFIRSLDSILNASNTVSERMGVFVAASPKDPSNAPAASVLSPEEKRELEQDMQTDYGALSRQNIAMLLPRPMDFQTINLAGLDLKLNDKVRVNILGICDRIKVPANQVAIIDATSSKSLSNGTELREGDLSKYRSFRRLLNATLFDFGYEIGLDIDYTIENEPKTVQGQTIEQPQNITA